MEYTAVRAWRVLFPSDCPLGIKIGEDKAGATAVTGFHKLPMRIRHGDEASIDLPLEAGAIEDGVGSDGIEAGIEEGFIEGPGRACGVIKRGHVIIRVNNDSCVGLSHAEIKRKVAYLKSTAGAGTLAITFSSKALAKALAGGTVRDEADAVAAASEIDARAPFARRRASTIEAQRQRWLLRRSKQSSIARKQQVKAQDSAPSARQSQLGVPRLRRAGPTLSSNLTVSKSQALAKPVIKKPLVERFRDSMGGWPRTSAEDDHDKEVGIETLRELAFSGVPDVTGLRSTVWRLLLDYLPTEVDSWQATLSSKRSLYKEWRKDLYPKDARRRHSIGDKLGPRHSGEGEGGRTGGNAGNNGSEGVDEESAPDPLSPSLDAHWSEHWKESALLGEIWKDVKRTNTQYAFFSRERDPSIADTLERLLFLFAKLNPGVRYVQGMNEVLAPILYCFYTDVPKEGEADDLGYQDRDNLEADVFFCFQRVMSYMTDVFVEELDEAECGIDGTLDQLERCLRVQDKQVYLHLQQLGLNPKFYAMRWLTTLLAREASTGCRAWMRCTDLGLR
jgi:hypothetical protein